MSPANEKTLCAEITEMVRQIRYGEIVISIHDSEVVQIEKREKKRYKLKRDDGFNGNA